MFEGSKTRFEDAVAASCAPKEQHGMAFGTLAAVNALGDFASSLLVGALWSAFNVETAFGFSAALSTRHDSDSSRSLDLFISQLTPYSHEENLV